MNLWKCPECGNVVAARFRRRLPGQCGGCDANLKSKKAGVRPNWDKVGEVADA